MPPTRCGRLLLALCATAAVCFLNIGAGIDDRTPSPRTPSPREPKLADGCHHVFLDVGSNIGMHVRFLLEPHLYLKAGVARSFFRSHLGEEGARNNLDLCVFSFEPNPSQWPRHDEMKRAYDYVGWRYHPIRGGVSDADGNLTFYHVGDETGFTMLKSNCRRRCDPEHVPVYDLADWIRKEVRGRELPAQGDPANAPKVLMKMDIEMMEYLVFPHLLDTGVMCNDIDAVMGEFHLGKHWFYFPITFPDRPRKGQNFTIENWGEAQGLKQKWLERMERDPNCTTHVSLNEDESHREDGMPFPHELLNITI